MSQCGSASRDGWLCLLAPGHDGELHMSIDNRRMYRGTPGRPVVWRSGEYSEQVSDELVETPAPTPPRLSTRTSAPTPRIPAAILQGYTGNFCAHCGSDRMRQTGTCASCENCGESGGCG